jgi:hypothetical protein
MAGPFLVVAALATVLLQSCARSPVPDSNVNNSQNPQNNVRSVSSSNDAAGRADNPGAVSKDPTAIQACYEVPTGDKVVMRSQTFPIDFPPFAKSCFVTSYNPDYKDPPLDSQYAIYKNGKKVFDFPERFNGAKFGCWVDAVSFADVNSDGRTDIIVVGKCSAKSGPYNENMVYINTGKTFETLDDVNNKVSEFKNAKDIADFVEENQQFLFK